MFSVLRYVGMEWQRVEQGNGTDYPECVWAGGAGCCRMEGGWWKSVIIGGQAGQVKVVAVDGTEGCRPKKVPVGEG